MLLKRKLFKIGLKKWLSKKRKSRKTHQSYRLYSTKSLQTIKN